MRRATVRNPVWPTIRWSGRTLRSVTCHPLRGPRRSRMVQNPCVGSASTSSWTCTVVGRYAHRTPPGSSTWREGPSGPHGSGRSRTHRSKRSPRDLVDVALTQLQPFRELAEEILEVRRRLLAMLVAGLVARRPARRGPTARQSAIVSAPDPVPASSTRAPGVHVGVGEDRAQVLRIDHLGAALHLQHEVREPRPERREHHPARRLAPRRPRRLPDQMRRAASVPRVRVERAARLQVARGTCRSLLVDQQDRALPASNGALIGAPLAAPPYSSVGSTSSESSPAHLLGRLGRRSEPLARGSAPSPGRTRRSVPVVGCPHDAHATRLGGVLAQRTAARPGPGSRGRTAPSSPASVARSRSSPPCSGAACCPATSGHSSTT